MILLSTLFISTFTTIGLVPILRSLAFKLNALDVPDHRKIHSHPIPKSGGIAMVLGTLISFLFWLDVDEFVIAILLGAAVIVIFGIVDDLMVLWYKAKFIGQIISALIVIPYGGIKIKYLGDFFPDNIFLPDWCSIPITLLVIVGVTNAINLSDGLDGLAGGISLLVFTSLLPENIPSYFSFISISLIILIIFIVLIIPILPDEHIQSHHMGLVAGKIIILLLSYEVLIGELRNKKLIRLALITIPALTFISVRGLIG